LRRCPCLAKRNRPSRIFLFTILPYLILDRIVDHSRESKSPTIVLCVTTGPCDGQNRPPFEHSRQLFCKATDACMNSACFFPNAPLAPNHESTWGNLDPHFPLTSRQLAWPPPRSARSSRRLRRAMQFDRNASRPRGIVFCSSGIARVLLVGTTKDGVSLRRSWSSFINLFCGGRSASSRRLNPEGFRLVIFLSDGPPHSSRPDR